MAHPQYAFLDTTLLPGSFIAKKQDVVWETTVLSQLDQLKKTGRYDAFKLRWRDSYKPDPNQWINFDFHLFWDSDIAKWIEGACYFLHKRHNTEIVTAVKELVDMIASAQQPDGYLNIHFTVVDPRGRFTNLRDMHEFYNCGHLIEAALAHHELYKSDELLAPILKYVDLISNMYGPKDGQRRGYSGHPEIELALARLYAETKNRKYLELCQFFLEERGSPNGQNKMHYYDNEARKRDEKPFERPDCFPKRGDYWYQQAHKRILEQKTIEGHSVRAMYLLTAVADLARENGDFASKGYGDALRTLWANMVHKKMYLTGGIGAMPQWEGFGIDYFLPQAIDEGGGYAETCASIGAMMLAERLLQLELNGEYADVMELSFYNAVMTGMSCDGRSFTYENQLASCDGSPSRRHDWFACPCCPPNFSRLLASIGGYLWSHCRGADRELKVAVHMYGSATYTMASEKGDVTLTQKSEWPWFGAVEFELDRASDEAVSVALRIPSWAKTWKITPEVPNLEVKTGYAYLPASYVQSTQKFRLDVDMQARQISPHPFTNLDIVALARGPIVYCVEDVDNPWVADHFKTVVFNPKSEIVEKWTADESTGESYFSLTAKSAGTLLDPAKQNILSSRPLDEDLMHEDAKDLCFIPFYYRANRGGTGQMRVGLRRLK